MEAWPAYRLDEAIQFIHHQPAGEIIRLLMVEGEDNVEICREMGLVAITLKGGTWQQQAALNVVETLKQTNKNVVLVKLHDNDTAGLKKAETVKTACETFGLPCVIIDPKTIFPEIIKGGDIREILAAMSPEEVMSSLEKQFSAKVLSEGTKKTENYSVSNKKKSDGPSSDAMGREIAEDYRNRLAFNNEMLCWYRYEADNSGVWSPETDEYIESVIFQILKSKGIADFAPSYVSNVVKIARHELIERKWAEQPGLISFQNGVLEIATGKLLPHSPGYKLTWALPRNHNPIAAQWTKISEWLDFAAGGNQHLKNILLAFCNATLKGRADIQKFLHLIGIGGSGKGTFMRLLVDLIGTENTHTSTLEDWCGNRFEAAQAYQKRLIIFPDEDKGARSHRQLKTSPLTCWKRQAQS